MRYILIAVFCLVLSASAQTAPAITALPLNGEQAAVYSAALSALAEDSPYDVINLTGVLRPDEGDYAGCMKGFPRATKPQGLHRLNSAFAKANHVTLTSPEYLADHSFPQTPSSFWIPPPATLLCPPGQPGLIRSRVVLSETIFNHAHHRAALNLTVTGPEFSHSDTHVYRSKRHKWLLEADCGSGIS